MTIRKALAIALFISAVLCRSTEAGQKRHPERYSTLTENRIQLHPYDVRFQIPKAWMGPRSSFRLTRRELRKARSSRLGVTVSNAALDFGDCAVQIEPDHLTWFRAYIVDWPAEKIFDRIDRKARAAVRKLPNDSPGANNLHGVQRLPVREGPWRHVDIPYRLDFGDYNTAGIVSFYVHTGPVSQGQLVIVVGYFDVDNGIWQKGATEDLLKSVVIQESR